MLQAFHPDYQDDRPAGDRADIWMRASEIGLGKGRYVCMRQCAGPGSRLGEQRAARGCNETLIDRRGYLIETIKSRPAARVRAAESGSRDLADDRKEGCGRATGWRISFVARHGGWN